MTDTLNKEALFKGLLALSESAFPKQCPNCKHIYQSAEEYALRTQSIQGKSGLKASEDDDGTPILELFRNCHCGSTLLDFFKDRRDTPGQRALFGDLLEQVCSTGMNRDIARNELIKVRQGQPSEILAALEISLKKPEVKR